MHSAGSDISKVKSAKNSDYLSDFLIEDSEKLCQQMGGFFKEKKFRQLFKTDLDTLSTDLGYQLINITIEDIKEKFIIIVTLGNKKSQYTYTIESLGSSERGSRVGLANYFLISENNVNKRQSILVLTGNRMMLRELVECEHVQENISNFYRYFEDKGLDFCFMCIRSVQNGDLKVLRNEIKNLGLQKGINMKFQVQTCIAFENVFENGFERLVKDLLRTGVRTEFFIEDDIYGAKKLLRSLKMLGQWDQLLKFDKKLLERSDSINCLEISKKILNLNEIIKNDDGLSTEQKLFQRSRHLVLMDQTVSGSLMKRAKHLNFYRHAIRTAGIVINYRSPVEEKGGGNRAFDRVFIGTSDNGEYMAAQRKMIQRNLGFWKKTRDGMSVCYLTRSYSLELDRMRKNSDYVVEMSKRVYRHETNTQNPLRR